MGQVLHVGESCFHNSMNTQQSTVFTPQPLRAVRVLFSPMVSGWAGGGKKFVQAVSQKP